MWRNQLGSELVLHAGADGELSGAFRTATGGELDAHRVRGVWDLAAVGPDCVLSFVVPWPHAHGVTAWVGRYRHADGVLHLSWLMATDGPAGDEWRSTTAGHDEFQREALD